MYSIFDIFILINLCVSIAQSAIFTPCHLNDARCIEASLNSALPSLLSENKTIGVESSDPLNVDLIEGNFTDIKFKFTSSVTTGFKQCVFKDVNVNLEAMKLHFELDCPRLETSGKYDVSGRLIILPVQGNGDFKISAEAYSIIVDCDLKTAIGVDNKAYLVIQSFEQKNVPKAPIKFDFNNLFNGQKILADTVITFANLNWKEVSTLLQDPVWNTNMKKIISNMNKYLMTEPLDQIFIQS